MRSLPILGLAATFAAALPAQWTLTAPASSPSQRRLGACAYDAPSNRLIFYGGVSPTPSVILPQTWSWNGTLWTQLNPTGGTLGRWGHQLVRNLQNNRLVTFGGRSPTLSGFANDTQEWTGTAWTTVPTVNAPSARYAYGMAFDSARNVVVLFGGRTNTQTLADTWEYDGINWTQRNPAVAPSPRQELAMAYDASLARTIVFGGYDQDTNTVLGDTWEYNGTDWAQKAPAASPAARYRGASYYDSTRLRVVVFGGYDGTTIRNDMFEYTGDTWTTTAQGTTLPTASTETLHGYDPVRKRFVVFGGFGGSFSSQTWELNAPNTGMFSTYGEGCPTAEGEAVLTSNTPRLGQPWTITASNLPSTLELVMVAYGFSNTTWNSVPLPVDLGVIGLPGCGLVAAADVLNVRPTAPDTPPATTNVATETLAIPNNTALLNTRMFTQVLLLDLDVAGFAFVGTTKGGRAVIGN